MLSPSICLTTAEHLITLLENFGLKRSRIVSFSSIFSPVSLRNSIPVLDKFKILTVVPSDGSIFEKQVPVNKIDLRKDLLFSKITSIVFPQIHSTSQFLDISISTKRITFVLPHEGHNTSALSLPRMYTFTGSIALRCLKSEEGVRKCVILEQRCRAGNLTEPCYHYFLRTKSSSSFVILRLNRNNASSYVLYIQIAF